MSSSRAFLFLLLGLSLCGTFVAGALLQPFGATEKELNSSKTAWRFEDSSSVSQPTAERTEVSSVSRRDDPGVPIDAAFVPPQQVEALARAFETANTIDPSAVGSAAPAMQFVVTGSVTTEDGLPLAGVTIRTSPTDSLYGDDLEWNVFRDERGAPRKRSLETVLRAAAERFQLGARDQRECMTDARGEFHITGLNRNVAQSVEALKEGYEILSTDGAPYVELGEVHDIRWIARPLVRVPLRIEEADGTLLNQALCWVETDDDRWTLPYRWNSNRPELWVTAGQYQFRATRFPETDSVTPDVSVTVVAGVEPPAVCLQFPASFVVRGTLRSELLAGEQRRELSLRIVPYEEDEPVADGYFPWYGTIASISGTGAEASYAASGLPAGAATLVIFFGERRILHRQEIVIGSDSTRFDIDLPPLASDIIVDVQVASETGRGIPDIKLYAVLASNPESEASDSRVVVCASDHGGTRWRIHHAAEAIADGERWMLTAVAPRLGTQFRAYDPTREKLIHIRFDAPARLEARIEAAEGLKLTLSTSHSAASDSTPQTPQCINSVAFDAAGLAVIEPVAPATYRLRALFQALEYSSIVVHEQDIALQPGTNSVQFPKPYFQALQVSVPQQRRDEAELWVAMQNQFTRLDPVRLFLSEGEQSFDRLPSGHYVLEVRNRSGITTRRAELDLPGPSALSLPPPDGRSAEAWDTAGLKIDPSASAAAAGLRAGDVLLSIAGHALSDPKSAEAILIAAPFLIRRTSYAVEILREGTRLELNLPRELLLDSQQLGIKR